ncbi:MULTISPECIES: gliding motility protein GldM [unclassified Capnocytophaga]|jgi:gliding motility-associated protein gldM|uniref:type IX secretion system motor protein PorM/GldM n=1 Tax=unclassified Capnocytophaga TaxID=2640652 RepID=UPI000202F486|nr:MULTISPECIES: gliding motility protein GldM [unclassified Capnocytophaga]EGD35385.1 gliding motility protein GldM [Capnocytophaga sp. oral taxon 338 str. F0234]MEB3005883.1 gliding motility protein GldM [Capnocytophaga sp. G2]
MAAANSPRQKMINLMYLVFIAMMALNMGKEVLSAFGLMNEKLQAANQRYESTNEAAFAELERKEQEKPDEYKEALEKSRRVRELSNEYYAYLGELKEKVMSQTVNKTDYQIMDQSDFLDGMFFKTEGLKPEGQKFLDNINNYRNELVSLLGSKDDELKAIIEERFSTGTNNRVKNRDGNELGWVQYNYEGFPYIAAVTKFSQIQSDVRQTEQDFYKAMLGEKMKDELSMKHYTTLLEQSRGAYYTNQEFDGAIVLGRKDNSTKPKKVELTLDGRPLSDSQVEVVEGKIKLKVSTGNIGEHKIAGTLYYEQDGVETPVEVSQTFTTIPRPNEAVISADKMNVVYRGVVNPMTISMPGVPDSQVTASAPGLSRKSGPNYIMKPNAGSAEVNIVVTGTFDGQKFSSSKKFRVKDIPKPEGAILRTTGAVKLGKSNVLAGELTVMFNDFDFDLTTRVNSFRILVPGQPSVVVQGNRVSASAAAAAAVNRAKKGDIIQISEIRYSVSGYSGTPKPATPVSIEIL